MATDIAAILRDLESCYDFTRKSVIHVGAGGGQLIGYAGRTRNVLGVDPDTAAAERFPRALDRTFPGVQRFHDHAELLARVEVLGECVIRRVRDFEGRQDFTIDMPYRVVLLAG